ncbi:MAG: putative Ig domain-containing protein [Verrucomicrobiota bacterium]
MVDQLIAIYMKSKASLWLLAFIGIGLIVYGVSQKLLNSSPEENKNLLGNFSEREKPDENLIAVPIAEQPEDSDLKEEGGPYQRASQFDEIAGEGESRRVKKNGFWLQAPDPTDGAVWKNQRGEELVYVDLPLYITTGPLSPVEVGQEAYFKFEAIGGSFPYKWSFVNGSLPQGFAFSPAAATLYGLSEEISESVFRIKVSDATGNQDIAEYRLSIILENEKEEDLLTIMSPSELPQAFLEEEYEYSFQADGGEKPYSWQLIEGALPPEFTFSNQASLSGTPQGDPDTYSFIVQVMDSVGQVATKLHTLEVVEPEDESKWEIKMIPGKNAMLICWNQVEEGKRPDQFILMRSEAGYPSTTVTGENRYLGRDNCFLDLDVSEGNRYYYALFGQSEESSEKELALGFAVTGLSLQGEKIDPYADDIDSFSPLHHSPYGSAEMTLGPPMLPQYGFGSTDVVSLGAAINDGSRDRYGGSIVLKFLDNFIFNGPGPDFKIFENVFNIYGTENSRFMEPAVVWVSKDGRTWRQMPFDFLPHPDGDESETVDTSNPFIYARGFAGVNPTFQGDAGGDEFDLAQVGLSWARYIRIQSTGDLWIQDKDGDFVRHTTETGSVNPNFNKSGFDLDAVKAIHY